MIERLALKHYERGRQFEMQDRVEEAVEAYTRACALEPLSAEPYLALGRLRAGRGQFQAALEVLMAPEGLAELMTRAVAAANRRSRELAA